MATSTATIPLFSSQQLEGISKVLGDTTDGLEGSEIGHFLIECGMRDPTSVITKWQRLYNALVDDQDRSLIGTHIMQFIATAMNPARYRRETVLFPTRSDRLNSVLAFAGYQMAEKAKVRVTDSFGTISESLDRANRLHSALVQRAVRSDALMFCRAEIVPENCFHAVFEAMKRISARIRTLSGLSKDGVVPVHEEFRQQYGSPPMAIIPSLAVTQRSERSWLVNLLD